MESGPRGGVTDIYTGLPVNETDMSLDHFIPWSFVLHDRLWNLAPVSTAINSSKSDSLPDLNQHLENFCTLQYMAFTTALHHSIYLHFMTQSPSPCGEGRPGGRGEVTKPGLPHVEIDSKSSTCSIKTQTPSPGADGRGCASDSNARVKTLSPSSVNGAG